MFKSLTIKARIISVICLLSATSIVVGWVGLSSLDSTSQALKSVYEDRLVAVSHLNAVQAFVQQNQTTVGRAVIGDTADMAGAADEIEQRIAKIGTIVERHLSNYPSAEEKALAKRLTDARKQFVGAGLKPAINALRKQDRQAASEIFKGPVLAIKELIGNSVEKVDAGSALVGQAGSTMEEIVESVKRVTDIMGEIMTASQEQSAGIEQVNQAIGQMDQVTQQNAALVEEAAAAAESLQEQAAQLAQTVSVFKVDGMGIAHQPASRGNAAVRTPRLSAIKPGSKRRNKKFS